MFMLTKDCWEEYKRARAYVNTPTAGLMTLAEFAAQCGVDVSTIRRKIYSGVFCEGVHCFRMGTSWVFCDHAFDAAFDSYDIPDRLRSEALSIVSSWNNPDLIPF